MTSSKTLLYTTGGPFRVTGDRFQLNDHQFAPQSAIWRIYQYGGPRMQQQIIPNIAYFGSILPRGLRMEASLPLRSMEAL